MLFHLANGLVTTRPHETKNPLCAKRTGQSPAPMKIIVEELAPMKVIDETLAPMKVIVKNLKPTSQRHLPTSPLSTRQANRSGGGPAKILRQHTERQYIMCVSFEGKNTYKMLQNAMYTHCKKRINDFALGCTEHVRHIWIWIARWATCT